MRGFASKLCLCVSAGSVLLLACSEQSVKRTMTALMVFCTWKGQPPYGSRKCSMASVNPSNLIRDTLAFGVLGSILLLSQIESCPSGNAFSPCRQLAGSYPLCLLLPMHQVPWVGVGLFLGRVAFLKLQGASSVLTVGPTPQCSPSLWVVSKECGQGTGQEGVFCHSIAPETLLGAWTSPAGVH